MSKLIYRKTGDYYIPNLIFQKPQITIGKYGRLRKVYLEQHHSAIYNHLLLQEQLYPHLVEVDNKARQMLDEMIPQLMRLEGVTEQLKMNDQLEWVGRMNNIKARVEEIIISKIVYR